MTLLDPRLQNLPHRPQRTPLKFISRNEAGCANVCFALLPALQPSGKRYIKIPNRIEIMLKRNLTFNQLIDKKKGQVHVKMPLALG